MIQGPPGTGKARRPWPRSSGSLVTRDKNVTRPGLLALQPRRRQPAAEDAAVPGRCRGRLDKVPALRVGLVRHASTASRRLAALRAARRGSRAVQRRLHHRRRAGAPDEAGAADLRLRRPGRGEPGASILDSLIPLVRGRRFILVGDQLQLQPVLSEAEEQLRLEPAVGNRTRRSARACSPGCASAASPRPGDHVPGRAEPDAPGIAGLISEVFYEGKLRYGRAPRRVAGVPLFGHPAVTWVDTRGLHGLRESRRPRASLVERPRGAAGRDHRPPHPRQLRAGGRRRRDLGVRRADRPAAPAAARRAAAEPDPQDLEIDTVDAFEGREKDIILVSLVRTNRRRDIGFLRLMQRINVALSRPGRC